MCEGGGGKSGPDAITRKLRLTTTRYRKLELQMAGHVLLSMTECFVRDPQPVHGTMQRICSKEYAPRFWFAVAIEIALVVCYRNGRTAMGMFLIERLQYLWQ